MKSLKLFEIFTRLEPRKFNSFFLIRIFETFDLMI